MIKGKDDIEESQKGREPFNDRTRHEALYGEMDGDQQRKEKSGGSPNAILFYALLIRVKTTRGE